MQSEEVGDHRAARCKAIFEALQSGATTLEAGGELPSSVTGWLLINPSFLLGGQAGGQVDRGPGTWRRRNLDWHRQSTDESLRAAHSVVELTTELSFGRQCEYRVHRFQCNRDFGSQLNKSLLSLDTTKLGAGVLASNVGGYHSDRDLFEHPATAAGASPFRSFLSACVAAAELGDQPFRGPDGAPPCTALREATQAWINISKATGLNLLHDHADSTWSGVYYVADGRGAREGYLGGQLLLRLNPPGGTSTRPLSYTDGSEQRHMARMVLKEVVNTCDDVVENAYAEVAPVPGTLLLFPGWLPHSVVPHLGTGERVSVSFNVFLQDNMPEEEEEEGDEEEEDVYVI